MPYKDIKKSGITLGVAYKDIEWVTPCPVLGTELIPFSKLNVHKISLDRVDNSKGYMKGNVRSISNHANSCKCGLTLDQIAALAAYAQNTDKGAK